MKFLFWLKALVKIKLKNKNIEKNYVFRQPTIVNKISFKNLFDRRAIVIV